MNGPSDVRVSLEGKEQRFFYLVGRIVTEYQQIEDYLPTVFRSALLLDRGQSDAIFRCVKGLEAKIEAVSAALMSRPVILQDQWRALHPKVTALAADRNKISHATPAFVHSRTIVTVSGDGQPLGAIEEGESHFRLEKSAKAVPTTYRQGDLEKLAKEAFELFGDLVVFVEALKGSE